MSGSWAIPVNNTCPRCESASIIDTDYFFELEINGVMVQFDTYICRRCGLKFDTQRNL